jgi:hypothetical protein
VPKAILADSLGIADAFLQAVLRQDFEFARDFVDPATVSDTKIAALCILFEEGEYRMRAAKPLRAMFSRGDTVGYLAHVVAADGAQGAEFALNLRQPPAPANWLVAEINLNGLITYYANRIAGGDVYYSPFVKNPAGGETLALYFGFDEDAMSDRTRRQLEIVAAMLKGDPTKKITLSGHTDALGTEDVPEVEVALEDRVGLLADQVALNEELDAPGHILHVRKARLAHDPAAHQPAGDLHVGKARPLQERLDFRLRGAL